MNCPSCNKTLAITKPIKPASDSVVCSYCYAVVPAETIAWSDGMFHFHIIGEVADSKISPRILMRNQSAPVLDLAKIHRKATDIIFKEPNLRAICAEFFIGENNISIKLIPENSNEPTT